MENYNDIEGLRGPFAKLTNDVAFGWVFGRNKDLLIALLNAFIPDRQITDVSLYRENQLPYSKEFKKSIFDVSCRTDDGSFIDVEVQVEGQRRFADRCLYYSTFNIQSQVEKGAEEYLLKPVYVISIDSFIRHHGEEWDGSVLTSYSLREDRCHELMTNALHFIFIELPLFTKKSWGELDNDAERFYFCFNDLHRIDELPAGFGENGVFAKVAELARLNAMPAELKQKYIKDMTTEIDKRAQLKYAIETGLEEGLRKGLEQGLARGEAIGMSKGRAEGLVEGKAEGRSEVARAMLLEKISVETIAKVTGLSAEQIRAL